MPRLRLCCVSDIYSQAEDISNSTWPSEIIKIDKDPTQSYIPYVKTFRNRCYFNL